jgi:hypothetical protein
MTFHPTHRRLTCVVALVLASLALAHCTDGANCDVLRQNLYDQRKAWSTCQVDADCLVLPGNTQDCTGVLTCPFAVNRTSREAAERKMLSIGDESVKCHLCATPSCGSGSSAICETTTHQCIPTPDSYVTGSGGAPGADDAGSNPTGKPDSG